MKKISVPWTVQLSEMCKAPAMPSMMSESTHANVCQSGRPSHSGHTLGVLSRNQSWPGGLPSRDEACRSFSNALATTGTYVFRFFEIPYVLMPMDWCIPHLAHKAAEAEFDTLAHYSWCRQDSPRISSSGTVLWQRHAPRSRTRFTLVYLIVTETWLVARTVAQAVTGRLTGIQYSTPMEPNRSRFVLWY